MMLERCTRVSGSQPIVSRRETGNTACRRGLKLLAAGALAALLVSAGAGQPNAASAGVSFVHGRLTVPTYTFGRAETVAPLFKPLEDMGYYPYTRLDWESRSAKPVPVEYESLVLENEYLRVEFLPELGGRVWSARDKIANRDLFYHTTVIKPARYNQRGAWPVGNFELYGPFDAHMLTYPGEPWAWEMRRHPEGSVSVYLSHIDHFFRDKVTLQVTIYPGKAFLETTIRLHNKNLYPNRYLLWTNAGVAVTDGSRFVYPMTKTIGHDSSALGSWPRIGGVDMTWNRNNKNMLGVFGLDIFDNFMSIYDYQEDYGTVCYTNRLLARGMKTWTFGSGLTALRHMAAYTDNDGLYMETQSGRFIWDGNYEIIEPGKSDGWTEYWLGTGKLGGLTTATRDVSLNWELPPRHSGESRISLTATAVYPQALVEVRAGEQLVWSGRRDLAFGQVVREQVELPASAQEKTLHLVVRSQGGTVLMDHAVYPGDAHPDAEYASDSIPRQWGLPETLSAEECYQKGLGHEKFGQMADAESSYGEALSKDREFSPAHLRLGLLALERFDQQAAREHFEKVLERDPTNGDAHYYLSLIHAGQGELHEARRHAYRLLPSEEKYHRRDYLLGLFALQAGDTIGARQKLRAAMEVSAYDVSVREAWAYCLRRTGNAEAAARERAAIIEMDPTNAFARAEELLEKKEEAAGGGGTGDLLDRFCAHHPQGYLELATAYMKLSAWDEALEVLERGIAEARRQDSRADPLLHYYGAWSSHKFGRAEAVRGFLQSAREQDLQLQIFPFRAEDVTVLRFALAEDPRDANAATLLGDLLYSRGRRNEAISLWRDAVAAQPGHFSALRNLGLGLFTQGKEGEGLAFLTRAIDANQRHIPSALLAANLNARAGKPEAAREVFRKALAANPESDQLVERLAAVETQLGKPARALQLIENHTFQPTHQTYALLHLYRAIQLSLAGEAASGKDYPQALRHIAAAAKPPSSLGVDDFATVRSSRLLLFEALIEEQAGRADAAKNTWREAAETRDDDVEGEGLFRAIALYKTGERDKAGTWFREFEAINTQRTRDNSLDVRTHAQCMAGFYAAFQGDNVGAAGAFRRCLETNQSYAYGRQALNWLEAGLLDGLRK